MREVKSQNDIPPAVLVRSGPRTNKGSPRHRPGGAALHVQRRPETDEDLAYCPSPPLAEPASARGWCSVELTKLSLERLKKYGPALHGVGKLTEEMALKQAEARGPGDRPPGSRGPLHGVTGAPRT